MKTCPRCKQAKPSDQFGKRTASPDGLQSACKECINKAADKKREDPEVRAKRAADERERRKRPEVQASEAERKSTPEYKAGRAKRGRDRRAENPGCDSPAAMKWVKEHPDERAEWLKNYKADPDNAARESEYQAEYYQDHAEKKKAESAQRRIDKEEELREQRRQLRTDNPELFRLRDLQNRSTRKARKNASAALPITREQLDGKIAYWGDKCWVCDGPWTAIDHVKPLAKGGAHMLCNLRPICTRHNSAKGAKWPLPTPAEIMRLDHLREQTSLRKPKRRGNL